MSDKNDIHSPHDLSERSSKDPRNFPSDLINMAPVAGKESRSWNPHWYVYQLAAQRYLPDTNQSLLVIGCGDGESAIRLATLGYDVQGIDSDPAHIDWATEAALRHGVTGNCRFHVMSPQRLDNAGETFDVIVGFDALQSDQLDTVVAQLNKVLKPGGLAIFKQDLITPLDRPADAAVQPTSPLLSPDDLQVIRQTFDAVQLKKFTILGRLDHLIPRSSQSTRSALQKLDQKLLTLCPSMARYGATAVITCYRHAQSITDGINFAA
jgi:SAM-dependent methyltransferase